MNWYRTTLRVLRLGTYLIALATIGSTVVAAQQASFGGTVLSEANEKPVANVEVVLEGLNRTVRSDSAGNFLFTGLSAGKHTVLVRQIGFDPLRTEFTLGATQKFEADLLIKPAVTQLQNVDVTAAATAGPWATKLMDFEERRRMGTGRFLTSDFFEQQSGRPASSFLMSKVPGLKFVQSSGRKWMASTRGCGMTCGQTGTSMEKIPNACYLQVVVNGIVRYNGTPGQQMFDIDDINSKDIIGLEFYTTATTPLQYMGTGGNGACGTIIIWTKGGV